MPGSQAESLGIKEGWSVLTIAGKKVVNSNQITAALSANKRSGRQYKIVFNRLDSASPSKNEAFLDCSADIATSDNSADIATRDNSTDIATNDNNTDTATNENNTETGTNDHDTDTVLDQITETEAGQENSVNQHEIETGVATLCYDTNIEQFPIQHGEITADDIDEVFCLTFVMPGCIIKLANVKTDFKGSTLKHMMIDPSPYVAESSSGVFANLVDGMTYWVYVVEDAFQEAQDRAKYMSSVIDENKTQEIEREESCSCIEGNPCVNEYGCNNWHNRLAVAKANGWKGF